VRRRAPDQRGERLTADGSPTLSLVVQAHNEERYLPRLLATVAEARREYEGRGGRLETIVADDASTDGTARIAAEHGCRVASLDVRNIGAARNGGARLAGGEFLAFVDADSRIHPRTFSEVDRLLRSERVVGGASGVTMERWSVGIAATWAVMVPLVWLTGFDTGAVFCRRADFAALGGYDERRRVAEDVDFLWRLWRLGRARGQRLARARGIKVVASVRKFDEHGEWHYFRMLPLGVKLLFHGDHSDAFVSRYWYDASGR
jgi:glycosyltransferase involved in cell wall biosynthesis